MGCNHPSNIYLAALRASMGTGAQAATEEVVDWSSGAGKPNPRAVWVSGSSRVKGETLDPVEEQRHCVNTAKAA